MQRSRAAFVLSISLMLALPGAPARALAAPNLAETSRQIIDQTNHLRRGAGLAATALNAQLTASAREFAQFMARTDRYGHEADGREPAQRAKAHGYEHCMVAENIAYEYNSAGFSTQELAQGLVEGWKQSPGHRRNMLDDSATETGVAIARSPRTGRYYAVQMFGRPLAQRVRFRVVNRSPQQVSYESGGKTFQLPPNVTRTHETCRADTLVLHLPGEPRAATVQPSDGDRYRVERVGSRFRLVQG
jgi:uncharacterized protein YkwD